MTDRQIRIFGAIVWSYIFAGTAALMGVLGGFVLWAIFTAINKIILGA